MWIPDQDLYRAQILDNLDESITNVAIGDFHLILLSLGEI